MSDYGYESDDWEPMEPAVPDEPYMRFVDDQPTIDAWADDEEDDDDEEC